MAAGARQQQRRLGLVFSGAGARAVFQVGAYEVLVQDPRFAGAEFLSCTSGGSINAAMVASGKTPAQMMDFWLRFADTPPVHANKAFFREAVVTLAKVSLPFSSRTRTGATLGWLFGRLLHHLSPDPGNLLALGLEILLTRRWDLVDRFLTQMTESSLLHSGPLRDKIVQGIGGETLPTGRIHIAINTIDVACSEPVRIVTQEAARGLRLNDRYLVVPAITVDHVVASAALPLLLPPVAYAGRYLIDGGLLVNSALAPAVDLGADIIVPILAMAKADARLSQYKNLNEAVERIAESLFESHYQSDRKLLLDRNRLSGSAPGSQTRYREVKLYQAIRPPDSSMFDVGSYLYFSRGLLGEMYEAGKAAAAAWLKQGPLLDSLRPESP
ncbi:MAG TPA: patatin-like phospholipase family protein [Kofleriaceae bacterium]